MLYRLPVLRYDMKYLLETFNDPKASKYKIDEIELKAYLTDRLGMKPSDAPHRFQIPIGYDMPDDTRIESKILYRYVLGRSLKFLAEKWVSKEQMESWHIPVTSVDDTNVTAQVQAVASSDDLPF